MDFDEALAAILDLIDRPVDVHVFDVSGVPRPVATLTGVIRSGQPTAADNATEDETIAVMLDTGAETAAILSLDRQEFKGGALHHDDAVTLRLGVVELQIAPRDTGTNSPSA